MIGAEPLERPPLPRVTTGGGKMNDPPVTLHHHSSTNLKIVPGGLMVSLWRKSPSPPVVSPRCATTDT